MNDFSSGDHFSGATGVLFEQAMAQTRMAVCLSDPNAPDDPIVFANRAFRELTGYDHDEIVGRNCRFLQGPQTDPESVARIRDALRDETVIVTELLNYRKDGTTFWNALHLGPIYDDKGDLLYFFGSQWDVTNVRAARAEEHHARTLAREISHRMKNMFSVIGAIVTMTGRREGTREIAEKINGRIRALGYAHENALAPSATGATNIHDVVKPVLSAYDSDRKDRITYDGESVILGTSEISLIGLVLHELATNATKYGALSVPEGNVELSWQERAKEDREVLDMKWIERNGPPVEENPGTGSGLGSGIIRTLLDTTDGEIDLDWQREGLVASITIPLADGRDT